MLSGYNSGIDRGRRTLWGVSLALLGASTMAGCSSDVAENNQEVVGTAEQEMVYLNSPAAGKSTTGAIPALADATGRLAQALAILEQDGRVHDGYYSTAGDLQKVLSSPGNDRAAWIGNATADAYASSTAFGYHLGLAADYAETRKNAFTASALQSAFSLFSSQVNMSDAIQGLYSTYPAERARWLEWQYGKYSLFQTYESKYTYSQPKQLQDLRYQGARLYCAARKAQFAQNGMHMRMGEISPIKLKLLGNWDVDLLTIEPTVSIDGPERFVSYGLNNGSQAFSVPLLLGNRIFPLKGLLPDGLGEIRYPTVLVAGDSEVYNRTNYRTINTSPPIQSYSRQYRSLSHADAIYNVYTPEVSAERRLELVRIGPLAAELLLRLGVVVGDPRMQTTPPGYYNDRVMTGDTDFLQVAGVAMPSTRAGRMWGDFMGPRTYSDAPILHNSTGWYFAPSNAADPSWWFWDNGGTDDRIRLRQNDDHRVAPAMRVSLTGGISGVAGGSISGTTAGITVALTATGSLTGTVSQEHDVRDGAVVEVVPVPAIGNLEQRMPFQATNVVVRPRTTADATVDFVVNLNISAHIKLPLVGKISVKIINADLIHASKDLGGWNSDNGNTWDTDTHMRIGYNHPMDPNYNYHVDTKSYLPLAGDGYNTFPGGPSDVEACLTDTTPLPPTPGVCGPQSAPVEVPHADVCLYTGGASLEAACKNPNATSLKWSEHWSNEPQRLCYVEYLNYLCKDTKKTQTWKGESIIAHKLILDPNDPAAAADADALNPVIEMCVRAFVGDSATQAQADAWAQGWLQKGVCTPFAEMISDDNILQVSDPSLTPPVVNKTPSGC